MGGSREIRFGAPPGIDTAALGKVMIAAVHETSPGEYLIETDPSPANISTLTTWLAEKDLPLADIRAGRQTLEDVFLRMTAITGEVPAVHPHPRRQFLGGGVEVVRAEHCGRGGPQQLGQISGGHEASSYGLAGQCPNPFPTQVLMRERDLRCASLCRPNGAVLFTTPP